MPTATTAAPRLSAFFSDASIAFASYGSGTIASYDPSLDGGGLGDVLNIVGQQALSALLAGCRYHSPHVSMKTTWRYSKLLSRADLCMEQNGWACVFDDALPRLPAGDPGWKHSTRPTGVDELRYLTESHCPEGAAARARHQLSGDTGNYCPVACTTAGAAKACGRAQLNAWCASHPYECSDDLAATVGHLLAPPECTHESRLLAHITGLLWTLAPPLAAHVDQVRNSTVGMHAHAEGLPAYVGMHVRRGDACKCVRSCCWSNADGAGRLCVAGDEYVRLAVNVSRALGVRHVYIATEDPDELSDIASQLTSHGLVPMQQAWRRDAFTRATRASTCAPVRTAGGQRKEQGGRMPLDGFVSTPLLTIPC